jgi:hypothetical protein
MKQQTTFILLFCGLFALPIYAADYYVSSIRSGRSDSNAGTNPDAPWATFGKVISSWGNLSAGDTVHAERGSQWDVSFSSDYFNINKGGSSTGGSITLRGDDYGTGSKPILRRTGGSGDCAFILITSSYVTVRDIELDGGHADYGKNTSGMLILADGIDVSNAQILNMKIHNLGGNTTAYICGIWLASWTQNTTSDCLIEGNEVSDYAAHGLNHYSQGRMNNIIWRNNYVHNNYTGGRFPSANAAMQITSGGTGCIFEYNWLEDTTTTEASLFGFGKYSGDTGVNTIRYNIITGSPAYGMIFTVDYSNMKLLYDVYGNIFMNNAKSGFAIHPYDSYASGTTFNIYNNTFYNNATGGDGSRSEMEIDSACNNTTIDFANNLMVHQNTGNSGFVIDSGFNGSFSHRNNLYWHEGGASRGMVEAYGQTYTVSNVRNFESTAVNEDPQFSDLSQLPVSITRATGPVPGGLAVQDGSPALGAGINLGSAYAVDILQSVRTDPWSMGAYQGGAVESPIDSSPPVVAFTEPLAGATVSGTAVTLSADASDDTGVAGVQFFVDGAAVGSEVLSAPFSKVWNSTTIADGWVDWVAVARDSAGNVTTSEVVSVEVNNAVEASNVTMAGEENLWENKTFASQSNRFAIEFDAVPAADNMDGVFGVSQGDAADYDDLAVIIRFSDSGQIDVRHGDDYTALAPVNYSAGSVCHFRLLIDISSHTYTVYVQVDDAESVILAEAYSFRASQATVASLDTLAITAAAGSHAVSNLTVIPAEEPASPTGLKATPLYE